MYPSRSILHTTVSKLVIKNVLSILVYIKLTLLSPLIYVKDFGLKLSILWEKELIEAHRAEISSFFNRMDSLMLISGLKRCLLCFKKGQYQVNLLTLLINKFSKLYTIKPVLRRALLCKGFIKLYCENFIFIYSSTKLHKYIILYWGEHFLFNNIQGCKRGTVFIDAVIFWI